MIGSLYYLLKSCKKVILKNIKNIEIDKFFKYLSKEDIKELKEIYIGWIIIDRNYLNKAKILDGMFEKYDSF